MPALVLLGTTTHALTGTAYTFQPDAGVVDPNTQTIPQSWRIRVWGDVNFHIAVHPVSTDATTSDMPVADHYHGVEVAVPPEGFLSVIKKTGEADGHVWFTRVKHA